MSQVPGTPPLSQESLAALAAMKQASTASAEVKASLEERARASVEAAVASGEKIIKTFYARINGMTHVFKDGTVARFINGEYHVRFKHELEELEALVKHPFNHLISDNPVPVQNPEGVLVLKDVGNASGTGMVNSGNLGGMAR